MSELHVKTNCKINASIAFIMCSVYAVVKCVCPHLIPERVRRAFLLISSSLVKAIFRRPYLLVNEWSIFDGI